MGKESSGETVKHKLQRNSIFEDVDGYSDNAVYSIIKTTDKEDELCDQISEYLINTLPKISSDYKFTVSVWMVPKNLELPNASGAHWDQETDVQFQKCYNFRK